MMPENPRHFGKYVHVQKVGLGTFAEVWKAFDPQLKRFVAIKSLYPDFQADQDAVNRLLREAQGVATLRHANIVQVYDLDRSPENQHDVCMIMDYIDGGTLKEYIERTSGQRQFPTDAELVQLFTPICLAVDYAHQHGMIHRDIKPANILLDSHNTAHNAMGEPMLTDFGLVKIAGTLTVTKRGQILGTPQYMSPEQAHGETATKYSDIYSLGVILYEMCTGEPPFSGEGNFEIISKHISQMPPPPKLLNPNISDALQEVILRCLAKDPQNRFSSASALALALANALSIPPSSELLNNIKMEEQASQQTIPPNKLEASPLNTAKPTREKQVQPPVAPLSSVQSDTYSSSHPVSVSTPVVPNPVTPIPSVHDGMLASSIKKSPNVAVPVRVSTKHPVAPGFLAIQTWDKRRTGVIISVLLLLAIISSLTWLILPKFQAKGVVTTSSQSVGQVSFFSTHTYVVDAQGQGEDAINDGIQGTLHLAPLASGERYYAWLQGFIPGDETWLKNALTVNPKTGSATLRYVDPENRNLLRQIGNNADYYNRFTVTEQQTTTSPSFESRTRLYNALLPVTPSQEDGLSYLDHIHHLLSSDPDLELLHPALHNGLDYWFLNNVKALFYQVISVENHTADLVFAREQIFTSIYYLRGMCAKSDIEVHTNGVVPINEQAGTIEDTQISLLDCSQTPSPKVQGYISHIMITHLNGIVQAPGVTTAEKQLVAQIRVSLGQVETWLQNVLNDALKLVAISNLDSPAAIALKDDMAVNAGLALSGQLNPVTPQEYQGASLICDSIQQLANMSVTAV